MAEIQISRLLDFANLPASEVSAVSDSTSLVVWTRNQARIITLLNPGSCKVLNFSEIVFCTISSGTVYIVSEQQQKQTITLVRKLRDLEVALNKGEQCKYIETVTGGYIVGTGDGNIIIVQGRDLNRVQICQEPITVIKANENADQIAIGTDSGAIYITNFHLAPPIHKAADDRATAMSIEYFNNLIIVTRASPCQVIAYKIEGQQIVEAEHNYKFREDQKYINVYHADECLYFSMLCEQVENVHVLEIFKFDGNTISLFTAEQLSGNTVDFRIFQAYRTHSEQWVDLLILRDGGSRCQIKRLSDAPTLMATIIKMITENPEMGKSQIILDKLVREGKNVGVIDERDEINFGMLNYIFSQNQGTLIAAMGIQGTEEWLLSKFEECKGKVDELMQRFRVPNSRESKEYVIREIDEIECKLYVLREVDISGQILFHQCDRYIHMLNVAKWFFLYDAGQYFTAEYLDQMQWGIRREQHASSVRILTASLAESQVQYNGNVLYIDTLSQGLEPPTLGSLKDLLDTLEPNQFHRVMLYVLQDMRRQNESVIEQLKHRYQQYFLIPESEVAFVSGMSKLDCLFEDVIIDKSSEASSAIRLLTSAISSIQVDKMAVFCKLVEAGCYDEAVSWGKNLSWESSPYVDVYAWVIVKTGNWYLYCGEVPKETIIRFMSQFKMYTQLIQIPEAETYLDGELLEITKTLYLAS